MPRYIPVCLTSFWRCVQVCTFSMQSEKFDKFFAFDLYQLEYSHDWPTIYMHVKYKHYSTILCYELNINSFHSDVTSHQKLKYWFKIILFASCSWIHTRSSIDHTNICISGAMHMHYIYIFCHQSALASVTSNQFKKFSIFSNRCHVINGNRIHTDDSVM
jgi:hypothetical protein